MTTTLDMLSPEVLKASKSPLIWTLGVPAALKHFRFKHHELVEAQTLAMRSDPDLVTRALDERAGERLTRCIIRNETKYPFIHRKFAAGEKAVDLAVRYKNKRNGVDKGKPLTRARVYQVAEDFQKWADRFHRGNLEKALQDLDSRVAGKTARKGKK
jgi:hypothetical protein